MVQVRGLLGLVALLVAGLAFVPTARAQTADVQIIHGAPDPGAASVDIYVGETLAIPALDYLAATGIVQLDAGVELSIGVAPAGSTGPEDIFATFPITLTPGESYVVLATGVREPGFPANPDGVDTAFGLALFPGLRQSAPAGDVALLSYHGAPNAPTVDIVAPGAGAAASALRFKEFSPEYVEAPAGVYRLAITPAGDPNTVVASYQADISGLGGGAAVVFATGYLDPKPGSLPDFGLYAALTDGTVLTLSAGALEETNIQIIHNSPDPLAASVDIYLGEELAAPGLDFRAATPIVNVPAGTQILIGIAGAGSMGVDDVVATIPVTLDPSLEYVVMATGVLDETLPSNPEGVDTAFALIPFAGLRSSSGAGNIDILAFHGAPDAPTVDVLAQGVGPLFSGLQFKAYSADYGTVPEGDYVLEITPAGQPSTVVARFEAPLTGLGGGAAVVFASGYLAPPSSAEPFGLFAALPDGQVITLPLIGVAVEDQSWGSVKAQF